MSELIVIGYPDERRAEEVLDELQALEDDYLVDLADAAIVVRDRKGRLHVTTTDHMAETSFLGGIFWGCLVGLIFFVPFAGALLGGAYGAIFGLIADLGIKQKFKEQVADLVQPGTSALLFVVRKMTPDKVLERLAPYGGTVLRTSLDHDAERKLQEVLSGTRVSAEKHDQPGSTDGAASRTEAPVSGGRTG